LCFIGLRPDTLEWFERGVKEAIHSHRRINQSSQGQREAGSISYSSGTRHCNHVIVCCVVAMKAGSGL